MVPGADAERAVFVFGISLSKIDHHVFVKGSLASQITTEEVKGQGEQVLRILMRAAITPATGAIAPGADVIGKKEDDFIHCLLLSGEPLHRTHLRYFLFLPLFKDNLTSAVVLKKLSEVTNRVMETYFTWVDHKNLNGGQEHGSREGSLPGPFAPPPETDPSGQHPCGHQQSGEERQPATQHASATIPGEGRAC